MTLIGGAMWLLSGIRGDTTGVDLLVPMVAIGAGMGSMMMPLNTHLLNAAPGGLVGRVTSLTAAMQNVVASLAIASYATVLQQRIPYHVSDASVVAGGNPSPALIENATAFAFGDVYRVAMLVALVGWCLVWTLRRSSSAASEPAPSRSAMRPTGGRLGVAPGDV
jgi:hypothetical protein